MKGRNRPIFVLGCPRSGTTLLALMLHAHPRIAIPPETRFVMRAYRRRERWGNLRKRANRRRLARWLTRKRTTKFADLGLRPRAVRRKIIQGPPTVGSATGIVLRAYARRCGKHRWGAQRPSYYKDVDALLRLFPDAQFVEVVRDGRDSVASLVRMPWFRGGLLDAVAIWAEAIDYGQRNTRRLRPDQWHSLRYEDLVADPDAVLARLCAYLGEEYAPAMAHPEVIAEAVPGRKVWHARLHQAVDAGSVGRSADTMPASDRAFVEYVLRRRLRAKGYRSEGSPAPRPPARQLAAYAKLTTRRRLRQRWWRLQDRRTDRRLPQPVAARLTRDQRLLARAERRRARERAARPSPRPPARSSENRTGH